jgi:hypothetical protein
VTVLETGDPDDAASLSFCRSVWHGIMLTPVLAPLWERGTESRTTASGPAAPLARRLESLAESLGVRRG